MPQSCGGHDRLRTHVLGLEPDRAALRGLQGAARTELVRAVAAGRRAGAGRFAGPDRGRGAHRQVRRPAHVPAGLGADHRPRTAADPGEELVRGDARRGLSAGAGRHDVRDRHPAGQLVVPALRSRARAGCVRHGHGRCRTLRLLHPADRPARRQPSVPRRRRCAGGVRGTGRCADQRPPGPEGTDRLARPPAGRGRATAGHLGTLRAVCDRLRRHRGVRRLSADLSEDLVRPLADRQPARKPPGSPWSPSSSGRSAAGSRTTSTRRWSPRRHWGWPH